MKRLLHLSLLVFSLFFIASCTISKDPAYDSLVSRLKNKGLIALSGENPYMASNLLITKEIENNESLRGFTEYKGVPNLIEVNKEYFKPLKYKFFYPNEQTYYNLELVNNTWVINGPETINAAQAQQIYYLTGGNTKAPNIILSNNKSPNNNFVNQQKLNPESSDPFIINDQDSNKNNNINNAQIIKEPINNKPVNKQNKTNTNNTKNQNSRYQSAIDKNLSNNNSNKKQNNPNVPVSNDTILDNIIYTNNSYPAELNYRGDLIHYVSYRGETLSLISRWYTKDPSNADKIARINSKNVKDSLLIGDKIIIPSYLIKNKNKLTQKALQDMIAVYVGNTNLNNSINTNMNNSTNKHTGYQGAIQNASNSNVNVPVNNNQKPANITIPKNIDGSEVEFF